MKFSQLEDLSGDELARRLEDTRETYMKNRFQHATAQLDNIAKLKDSRRDIARMMTLLNQRRRKAVKENTGE